MRQLESEKQKRFKLCIYNYSICIFYSVLITFIVCFSFCKDTKVERYGKIYLTYPKCSIVGELDEPKIRLISQSAKNKKSGAPLEAPLWARKNRIHYITCYCLFLNFTVCCLPFDVVKVFFILYVRLHCCRKTGIEAGILTFYLLNIRQKC